MALCNLKDRFNSSYTAPLRFFKGLLQLCNTASTKLDLKGLKKEI